MAITPNDRWIQLSSVFNFRDLGGLPTMDGRKVKRGKLFRSDSLGRLEEADRDAFAALSIRRVIDLRRSFEVASMGKVPDWTRVAWHHHHLEHDMWDHGTYSDEIGVARWLADRYADLLATGGVDLGHVIRLLSDVDDGPTVVHCVAGKDRTGLVSALVLSLLDVSPTEIANDYALTELSETAYMAWLRRTSPEAAARQQPVFYTQTPAQAMAFTLDELSARYGSVREYLGAHGVTATHVENLRHGLVE